MLKPPAPHSGDRALAGVGFMLLFAATAPLLDMFAKLASESPPAQTAFARFAAQAVAMALILRLRGRLVAPPRGEWALHAGRGALLAGSTVFFFLALTGLPMAEALAIFFVEPLILTLLSGPLLGETVGWRRYLACAAGFCGALLVVRPGFAAFGLLALAPVAAATCFALYLGLTRRHALRLDPLTMQLWSGVAGAALLGAVLTLGWLADFRALSPRAVDAPTLALLLGVGAFATVAHLAIAAAFARAPASVLAPFQYLEIVTATLAGWLAFGDFPDAATWAGVAIIVGAGLVVFHRERVAARRLTPD